MSISGSCLCGGVTYSISDRPKIMNLCHCSMCRKFTGSTYGTFAHIDQDKFQWAKGEKLISRFESSAGEFRAFCRTCGSGLPVIDSVNNSVCIPAGSFDDDPGVQPLVEIFLEFKAPWYSAAGDIAGYEEFPPDNFEG